MTTIHVRRTQRENGALVRQLRVASLTEAPYAFGVKLEDVLAQSDESFDEVAERHSTSEVSTSFILFSESYAVGTVGAFFEQSDPSRAFICALWVDPRLRGTSAARDLVSTAVHWLAVRKAPQCFAWVADSNARAIAFYQKLGFVATNEVQPLPSHPSQLETLWHLWVTDG